MCLWQSCLSCLFPRKRTAAVAEVKPPPPFSSDSSASSAPSFGTGLPITSGESTPHEMTPLRAYPAAPPVRRLTPYYPSSTDLTRPREFPSYPDPVQFKLPMGAQAALAYPTHPIGVPVPPARPPMLVSRGTSPMLPPLIRPGSYATPTKSAAGITPVPSPFPAGRTPMPSPFSGSSTESYLDVAPNSFASLPEEVIISQPPKPVRRLPILRDVQPTDVRSPTSTRVTTPLYLEGHQPLPMFMLQGQPLYSAAELPPV